MKKNILYILSLIFICSFCMAGSIQQRQMSMMTLYSAAGGGGGGGLLIDEDCNGTGTPSGWTDDAGTPDWDSATDLGDSESLNMTTTDRVISPSFASVSYASVCFKFRVNSFGSTEQSIFRIRNAANSASVAWLYATSGGDLKIKYAAGTASSGYTISTATTYFIWLDWTKGSGDGTLYLYVSTSGTKGSADLSITDGTTSDDAGYIRFESIATTQSYFVDLIKVDDSEIGDQ